MNSRARCHWLTTRAITAALNDVGNESSPKDVASALLHLLLASKVHRVRRGSYRGV